MTHLAIDLPLAIDLDGIVDLYGGDLRLPLIFIAVTLALLLGTSVWVHMVAPVGRRIHKRVGR